MKLIKNGIVIDPAQGIDGEFDLLIEGSAIKDIKPKGSYSAAQVKETIDASGCWVMPGFVDMHVHLREPGFEWKETIATGSKAAILGGYTSICCMPNTKPSNDTAQVTEFILDRARVANLARVYPIGAVSIGLKGEQMAPLSELRKAGCVAFSDDGEPIYNSAMMRRALEWCRMMDAVICCHEEDKNLTCGGCMNESALSMSMGLTGMPTVGEDVMVSRDIELARYTGGRVHICHVSTARSVELIRRAKNDGIRVTCEVTPHHIQLTQESVIGYNTNAKMSPPLREESDRVALVEGLRDGTIDAIASDHAPHDLDTKQKEFSEASFGILGLQTSFSIVNELIITKKLSRLRAVEILSTLPAKILGINAGTLKPGAPADISIINPSQNWKFDETTIASISKNTPFIGKGMVGAAKTVLVGGEIKNYE